MSAAPRLQPAPSADDPAHACAALVLASVPALMRELRAEMRRSAPEGLGLAPFRALIFAHTQPGRSIGALAAHLGVSMPTASVTVEKLVQRGLLVVATDSNDRRQRQLHATTDGARIVRQAMRRTTDTFARQLAGQDAAALERMARSLKDLTLLLAPSPGAPRT